MQARAYILARGADNPRLPVFPVMISMICHLIFFALIVYSPRHSSGRRAALPAVNVSLVALSEIQTASEPRGAATQKAAVQSPAQPPPKASPSVKATASKPKATESVSLAPKKWSEKTSLKKETFKPAQVVKQAIKQIEERTEETSANSVAAAIDRIRGEVGRATSNPRSQEGSQTPGTAAAGSELGGSGEGSGWTAPEKLVYQQEIAYRIRNNWVYPEQLAGQRKDLEARLVINIAASGEIKDVQFKKRSGNSYLDESAYKAVVKSNPLPALPKGYQFYTVILGFTPAGLQ